MAAATKVQNLSGNNFMIVMLLITLLVLGGSALAVKSLYGAIVRDGKVREAKSKADEQLKKNVEAAPRLVDAFNALGSEKTVLANALPNTADFPSLLVLMENMTNVSGLKLKTVSPAVATGAGTETAAGAGTSAGTATVVNTAPAPQAYQFSVTFDGSYDALQRFLAAVEVSARPLRTIGMQLNGSANSLSGQVDLETYFQDKATLPITKETVK